MKRGLWVGGAILLVIFLMFKEVIFGWLLIVVVLLIFSIPLLFLLKYFGKLFYKELHSPEANAHSRKIRAQHAKEAKIAKHIRLEKQRICEKEQQKIHDKRSVWK